MGVGPMSGGVPLGRGTGQINVTDIRLLIPSSLRFSDGGCDQPGCVVKCEVIDLAKGHLSLIPMTLAGAIQVHEALGGLINEHQSQPAEGT